VDLVITGMPINVVDYSVSLNTGWKCIGYVPNDPRTLATVFAGLIEDLPAGAILEVKESGVNDSYYKDYDLWASGGTGEMTIGNGYWVKVPQEMELNW